MRLRAHPSARFVLAVSLAGLTTALGVPAAAQPTDPRQTAVAQALVEEGRKLMESGKLDAACPKFQEAVRILPKAVGALAQLAECYEKAGRFASAFGTWVEVENTERSAGHLDRADYAKKRLAELAPRSSKLTIVVPDALRTDGSVEVLRDGAALTREQWGLPVPVDAGRHTVRITATRTMKSKALWEAEIDIVAGDNVRLVVPMQHEEAPAPPGSEAPPIAARPPEPPPVRMPAIFTPATPPADDEPGKVQRRVGIGVGAVGVAALEVAGAFLAVNLTKGVDYDTACNAGVLKTLPNGAPCQQGLHDDTATARTAAVVSGVAGAVALVGGIVIYATAPTPRRGLGQSLPRSPAVVVGAGSVAGRLAW